MTTNQLYKILLYAAAKNRQQGYISPDDFNDVLMPKAQAGYLDYLRGEYQKYQIRRPISVVEFGQNQMIRTSIAPLVYGAILNINISGVASPPSDYEFVDAMWGVYGNYNIKFIQQDKKDDYIHSTIDPIIDNPVYLIDHEGFNYFPERPYNQNQAKLSYVRTPPAIFWAYTLDANGRAVYDPVNSQQPVWGDTDIYEILVRALDLIGINLSVPQLVGYANNIKNEGQ